MKFWLLGTGTGVPHPERGAAGYLAEVGDSRVLFDCGMGTLGRLQRLGIDCLSIDFLFLSHHHPDHCADTVALLFANSLESERRNGRTLRVVGPPGTSRFLKGLYDAFPGLEPTEYPVAVEEHLDGVVQGPGFTVRAMPVVHTNVAAVGYRIEADGMRVVYSGDTGECDEVVRLADGADVFVSECSYPDTVVTKAHLTPSAVARVAQRAGVARVVLSHRYPAMDQVDAAAICRQGFGGTVEVGEDCTRVL